MIHIFRPDLLIIWWSCIQVYSVLVLRVHFEVQRTENIDKLFYYHQIQGAEHRNIDYTFK